MPYQCEALSVGAFIQQLAVGYVARGYLFYATGSVPERKDLAAVDAKLLERYDIGVSRWARARRKRAGVANVQYLRHGRFFVLLATHGRHPFFEEEGRVRDIRRSPLRYAGYSVSFRYSTVTRRSHASVRIDREEYLRLRGYFLEFASKRSCAWLATEFQRLPFEPYAPVRRQVLNILRAVNRARREGGLEPVPAGCLRLRRRPVAVFKEALPKEAA